MNLLFRCIIVFLLLTSCGDDVKPVSKDSVVANDSVKKNDWKKKWDFTGGHTVWVITARSKEMRDPGNGKWYKYSMRNIITNEVDTASWMPETNKIGDTIQASLPL